MKKFFSSLILAGAVFATASAADIYISTSCLINASFPSVGKCVSSTYGTDCNFYAPSGSDCVGFRTVVDKIGV